MEETRHEGTTRLMTYLPSVFARVNLPFRCAGGETYRRECRGIDFTLYGMKGLPYGRYARLILLMLSTCAVNGRREEDGTVAVTFASLSDLLSILSLQNSRTMEIKDQLLRFSGCIFSYRGCLMRKNEMTEGSEGGKLIDTVMMKKMNVELIERMTGVETAAPGRKERIEIILAPQFVTLCREYPVPVEGRAYRTMSSLGKDIYAFIMYRSECLMEGEKCIVEREMILDELMPSRKENIRRSNWMRIKEEVRKNRHLYGKTVEILKDGLLISMDEAGKAVMRGK